MHESTIIQRALLTVFDKTHIIELAEFLHLRGIELLSTGKTAALLKEHGLPVIQVSDYTGFPEMMDGRVKTLHPKIHGGILGRRDIDADIMIAEKIHDIDLVVVNLYPFQSVIQKKESTFEEAIENIDIGGPTMIRGAAKNHAWCTVIVDPNDYKMLMNELDAKNGAISDMTRFHLAAKAFAHTAQYDDAVANYFGQKSVNEPSNGFGSTLSLHYHLKQKLRYGENPHQHAAFYQESTPSLDSIAAATQQQGKALSFNNIADANTALECVKVFEEPACVIVKHANPCGVATTSDLIDAYHKAYACDPTSAFGGIIAFNQTVDEKLIQTILAKQFVEVLIAPHFTEEALEHAKTKPQCRLLQYHKKGCHEQNAELNFAHFQIQSVNGGILVQTWDDAESAEYRVVTTHSPTPAQMLDLIFSWRVARFVKSNAIVYAKNGQALGIGAGQMSRVFSTEIAALKAKQVNLSLQGAVMASDAFFPFKDNLEKAHEYGITAIIQPGGSIRDEEIIACANSLGIAMVFTGVRHFRH